MYFPLFCSFAFCLPLRAAGAHDDIYSSFPSKAQCLGRACQGSTAKSPCQGQAAKPGKKLELASQLRLEKSQCQIHCRIHCRIHFAPNKGQTQTPCHQYRHPGPPWRHKACPSCFGGCFTKVPASNGTAVPSWSCRGSTRDHYQHPLDSRDDHDSCGCSKARPAPMPPPGAAGCLGPTRATGSSAPTSFRRTCRPSTPRRRW